MIRLALPSAGVTASCVCQKTLTKHIAALSPKLFKQDIRRIWSAPLTQAILKMSLKMFLGPLIANGKALQYAHVENQDRFQRTLPVIFDRQTAQRHKRSRLMSTIKTQDFGLYNRH